MNIIIRELWANRKSLIIWSVSMIAFVVMTFAEFSAYYKNPEMLAVIEAMPREMLEAFGMAGANLTTVSGYMGVATEPINLALGIYAVLLGNGIIAKEERDKTAGFLMTLPVTRIRVITGKLMAAAICCAILLAVVAGSIMVSILPYEVEEEFPAFMLLVIFTAYATMLIFLSIGMFLAALIRRHKISGGLGIGLIFALYLASIIAGLSENMDFLKYVSPFKYFEASQLLRDLAIEPIHAVLSAATIVLALVGTYIAYERRDLYL
jgi:ABC-2 type transport system permease protein